MLNYRLHQCMDLIVEGVDTGDVRLIIQESAAFQSAFNELKGSIDDFIKLIGEVGLEGLKEPYANLNKLVGEAEQSLQDMPDEWDWKGQVDALKKPTGDSPPETTVSKIALDHDTNVNACKDGIIEIAEYLEQYKDIFNVGSAGLSLNEKFKSVLKVEQFALAQLVDEDVMFKLVGVEKGTDQTENEKTVKEAWSDFWDADKKGEEKKWTDFTNLMEKLAGGIPDLYNNCGKAIKEGKPSDDFQSEVPKQGLVKSLLGGLFGGSSPTKIDPGKVMGNKPDDPNGLLGMPFENLSALVVGLLEMAGAVSEASSGAVEAIDDNQEELVQDIPSKEVRDILIKGYGEKPKDEQDFDGMPKTRDAMLAFREILKTNDFTVESIGKIEELPQKLTQVEKPYSEEGIKELLTLLDLMPDEEEEEESQVKEFKKDEWAAFFGKDGESNMGDGTGEVLGRALEDLGLLKLTESIQLLNEGLVEDLITKVEEYTDIDDKLKKAVLKKLKKQGSIDWIKGKIELQESFRLIDRWGVLAGIIKG